MSPLNALDFFSTQYTLFLFQNPERNPFYWEGLSDTCFFQSSFCLFFLCVFTTSCVHFFYLLSIWDDNYWFPCLSPSLACEHSEGRTHPSVISEALMPRSWSEPSNYLMNEGMNAMIQPRYSSCFQHPSILALLRGKGPLQSPRSPAELEVWVLIL